MELPLIPFNEGDMWLFYRDIHGASHVQHWRDVQDVGTLIDEEGNEMELVGWGTVT